VLTLPEPGPETPCLVQQRRLEPVHVGHLHSVRPVVEEGELVVNLLDPRVLPIILALGDPIYLLLELLQAWGGKTNVENCVKQRIKALLSDVHVICPKCKFPLASSPARPDTFHAPLAISM
jgi:hypothetical protein